MAALSITEFVEDPARMKAYAAWLADPVTQEMIAIAKEQTAPAPLRDPRGETALYQYGLTEGANLIITLLTNMDGLVKQGKIAKMLAEDPTYGAEKIVEEKYK